MGGPTPQQLSVAQGTTQSLGITRFDKAALLVGRSFYWATSPLQHIAGLATLIRWCLALPDARLGVSVSDVATLARDMYAVSPERSPAEVQRLQVAFARLGMGTRPIIPWELDHDVWWVHRGKLLAWLDQASRGDEYVWLEPEDTSWWITATMRSLASYSGLFGANVDPSDIYRLISRHVCTVFAPFDGGATYDHLEALIETLAPERRNRYQDALAIPLLERARLEEIRGAFWSWRLIDFANVGSIVCTPMLALWSERPSSAIWAPPSLAGVMGRRQFTSDEVTTLLQESFWLRLETLFSRARAACGLGVAEPEFADVGSRPPLFFFASPVEPPLYPEAYAEDLRSAIHPLVRTCLLSADPLADQIAWGLLEGNVVALRRELSTRRNNEPRYLLLPTSVKSTGTRSIEDTIGVVADRLTFLEFSIGHEVRDVYTDMNPLAVRRALWSGTLDSVNDVIGEAIDLLPAAHRRHLRRINDRLAALHLVLRRLQTFIETAASDTTQVESRYGAYLDGTDDYLRRVVTSSSVPHVPVLSLRDAIQHAYPYQYVRQPLESLRSNMNQLTDGMDRINTSLNTILDLSDRHARDLSSRLGGIFNLIIVMVGLLVGLLQVLGAQGGNQAKPASAASTGLIGRFIQSSGLDTAAQLAAEIIGVGLIVAACYSIVVWALQHRPRRRHKFLEGVQRFRALVSAAERYLAYTRSDGPPDQQADAFRRLDELDTEAVTILAGLWQDLLRARDRVRGRSAVSVGQSPQVRLLSVPEWEVYARTLEHAIELFDLSPQRMPLPRALCVLRFKSSDLHSRTMVSAWDFAASLHAIGYSFEQARTIEAWLSVLDNQQRIKALDVATFARVLEEHGVTAIPNQRRPDRWHDVLDGSLGFALAQPGA